MKPANAVDKTVRIVGTVIAICVMLGGLLLAMRNLRLNRGDPRGGFRLAAAFVVLHTFGWVLWTDHIWTTAALHESFVDNLAFTLFEALTLFTLYLALEPFVRRRWPDALISWNRLLAGRIRDPLVGRDLLFGSLIAVILSLLVLLHQRIPEWLGLAPDIPMANYITPLLGVRFVVGEALDILVHQIVFPMGMLVFFLLLSSLFRRQWAAALVLLAIAGLGGLNMSEYWFQIVLWELWLAIALFAVVRIGLVTGIAATAMSALFMNQPITSNLGAWYAGSTVLTLAVFVFVAGYGFLVSLGGRSPFAEGLLRE